MSMNERTRRKEKGERNHGTKEKNVMMMMMMMMMMDDG